MLKNVILVDGIVDEQWDYKVAVEKITGEKWEILCNVPNQREGRRIRVILRYIKYFLFSFSIFIKRKKFQKVIAWQQFYGLIVAFYCRLFKVKHFPDIYVMTFIYKPKKILLYNWFIHYIITSGYIKKLIVLSDSEKRYYAELFGIDESIFHCTRIGVPDLSEKIEHKPDRKKYWLSVGRSNRDYSFLQRAWKKEWGNMIVISDSYREPEKDGITCLKDCFGDDYIQMLADCYAVVIPLDDPHISSGSLSFLQAMMLSKPVIVTENDTVHDYIQSGYNAYIINKNNYELEQVVLRLEDYDCYNTIANNARKSYVENFSEYSLGEDIGKLITGVFDYEI